MSPEEIKEIRAKLGVSQEKFASILGTTCTSVNRWENGKARPSRLYVKEIKNAKASYGKQICERE